MDKQQHIPLSLIVQHRSMFKAMGKIGIKILSQNSKKTQYDSWEKIPELTQTLPSPNERLIEEYIHWSGVKSKRYQHTIPRHMVSQWGLPLSTELMLLTPYNLASVINQGVCLKILGDLPRGKELVIKSRITSIKE